MLGFRYRSNPATGYGLARGFDYRCKQAGQLASKMRLMTAPLLGMIETGAWQRNARHANECAAYLASRLTKLGITPAFPQQANAVFIRLTASEASELRQPGWSFHISDCHGAARFMCGWDSQQEWIDRLVGDIKTVSDPEAPLPGGERGWGEGRVAPGGSIPAPPLPAATPRCSSNAGRGSPALPETGSGPHRSPPVVYAASHQPRSTAFAPDR
jgi:hypothetical protein